MAAARVAYSDGAVRAGIAGKVGLSAAIFLPALLVFLLSADRSVNPYDEGLILTGAMDVAAGAIPHRDFYANYGPAQFYCLALLFKLFGPSVLVERCWAAAVKAGIAVAAFFLSKRVASAPWSSASLFCCVVWLAVLDTPAWPVWPSLLGAIASLLCLTSSGERVPGRRSLFLAGLMAGVTALFRYDIGMTLGVTLLLLSVARTGFAATERRVTVGSVVRGPPMAFTFGFCALLAPVGAAFYLAGVLPDLWFDIVSWPAGNYAAMRSLPFPAISVQALITAPRQFIVYFPLLAGITAVLRLLHQALAVRARDRAAKPESWFSVCLLGAVTLVFFVKGVVRVSPTHMGLAIIPAFILSAALLSNRDGRRWTPDAIASFTLASLIALRATIDAATGVVDATSETISWLLSPAPLPNVRGVDGSCRPAAALERAACFQLGFQTSRMLIDLATRTRADEFILVGLSRHDRMVENDVSFYFLANRRPGTKWYHFDPGLQTTAVIQQQIIADLRRHAVRYLILDSQWEDALEPNASALSSGVHSLDRFIRENYRKEAEHGSLTLWRAAGSDPASPQTRFDR